jgi:hypothetical protein
MNFHHLTNNELVANFGGLVRKERQITAHVLACIAEIDRRQLYAERGHSSLFEFLVRDFGYSPGAAMRRIDGARLLRELPDVQNKIESGTLTLSQANQIQRAAREMKKAERFLSTEEKQKLILQLEHASKKETEKIIAEGLDLPVIYTQKQIHHRDASVKLTMTFSVDQIEVLEQARNMASHSLSGQNWSEFFVHLANKELARRTKIKSKSTVSSLSDKKIVTKVKSANDTVTGLENAGAFSGVSTKNRDHIDFATVKKRRALSAALRKRVLTANARCQFKNKRGELCNSSRYLQIDHIRSVRRGGENDFENLQVLCGTHNRHKYIMGR